MFAGYSYSFCSYSDTAGSLTSVVFVFHLCLAVFVLMLRHNLYIESEYLNIELHFHSSQVG